MGEIFRKIEKAVSLANSFILLTETATINSSYVDLTILIGLEK